MSKRGDELRTHILLVAKGVFLEAGFERASMDEVARRAATSKRSVYAHFESKEQIFFAVVDFVRGLFLERLKAPSSYSSKPSEALVLFCGRYLEMMLYAPSVRLNRVILAEGERLSEAAARHHEILFGEVSERLSAYLKATFRLSARASAEAAQRLLAQILFPVFPRALFGVAELVEELDAHTLSPRVDLRAVRRTVAELLRSLPRTQPSVRAAARHG